MRAEIYDSLIHVYQWLQEAEEEFYPKSDPHVDCRKNQTLDIRACMEAVSEVYYYCLDRDVEQAGE